MNKAYQGFDDLEKNCPFIAENCCQFSGQGLYLSYDVKCLGTGSNNYILYLLDNENQEHIFMTEDNFIIDWSNRYHPEELDAEEEYEFRFEAFGILDNKDYVWFYSRDCDDNTLFDIAGTASNNG